MDDETTLFLHPRTRRTAASALAPPIVSYDPDQALGIDEFSISMDFLEVTEK